MKDHELREDVEALRRDLAKLKQTNEQAQHQADVMEQSLERLAGSLAKRRKQREDEEAQG